MIEKERSYRFVLRGFNLEKFWRDLSLREEILDDFEIEEYGKGMEKSSDLIYDVETLKKNTSDKYIRYMGNCSDKHKLWIVDLDVLRHISMPVHTGRRCDRCHHTFFTNPVGCPIHYINLNDNTNRSAVLFEQLKIKNLNLEKTSEIFITKKIFCGLNCVHAWIIMQRKIDPYYEKCFSLLTLLVQKLEKTSGLKLNYDPSPPIEMLKAYGGELEIEEYRNVNGQLIYNVSKNIQAPLFFPAGEIVEEMLGSKMLKKSKI